MNIVVLDGQALNPGDLSWKPFEKIGKVTVYKNTKPSDVVVRCKDADAIIINKTLITKDVMTSLPCLKYIGVCATGYNVIDIEDAKMKGITVCNVPDYSTVSVAQLVFAHLLNIANRVGYYATENKKGRWCNSEDFCYMDFPSMELAGKIFGIIGFGHIGQAVANIAISFGMKVLVYTSKSQENLPKGIIKSGFEDLLKASDVLSLHCPLTKENRNMINKGSLSKMKSTAVLINTARGPLVNEQDVADALNTGHLAAYGADVLSVEPPTSMNPILAAKNSYITPHIAWATYEARQRLMDICLKNLESFAKGTPQNQVF